MGALQVDAAPWMTEDLQIFDGTNEIMKLLIARSL
jgi:hypothetical protein